MQKPVVLLVEDEKFTREVMTTGLTQEGYTVLAATNADEFSALLQSHPPALVLLDLMLPDGDGLKLMEDVRRRTDIPVIIVSGKNELTDRIVGLELGADDYIGKPVQVKELTARVKAQLRRYQSMKEDGGQKRRAGAERLSFGPWVLDRPQMQAFDAKGASANLSVKEFRLLEALVLSSNRVLSRAQLLDMARADDHNVTDRAIDVQILRIRRKLNDKAGSAEIIRAIRGAGYMCTAEAKAV
jgi:two-component system OmpR family response regulator